MYRTGSIRIINLASTRTGDDFEIQVISCIFLVGTRIPVPVPAGCMCAKFSTAYSNYYQDGTAPVLCRYQY